MAKTIRLGDFILENMEPILKQWEEFAKTINAPDLDKDRESLRDHAGRLLHSIAQDLIAKKSEAEKVSQSKNSTPAKRITTVAEVHAEQRLYSGFTIGQLFSEYRELRSSILLLWGKSSKEGLSTDPADISHFHEAIDQAIAESIDHYTNLIKTSQDIFLAILGHDLRNPLSTTIMSSMVLMRNEDDKVISAAARIYNSAQRMNRLITDLMDYTRGQLGMKLPVVIAPTNLAKICTNIIEEQQIANPDRSILIEMKGSFDGNWDEQRIDQVFSNLLGNAIQHGNTSTPIKVNLTSSKNSVVIKITNQGKPIPASKIKHIFDPLVRYEENENADNSQKTSMGLGLYIAREIILAHNGDIKVTSSAAKGTTFEISLPR